jgi:hypothetical protein
MWQTCSNEKPANLELENVVTTLEDYSEKLAQHENEHNMKQHEASTARLEFKVMRTTLLNYFQDLPDV